jgi:hypothetical protein
VQLNVDLRVGKALDFGATYFYLEQARHLSRERLTGISTQDEKSGRIFTPAQSFAEDSAINKKAAPDNSEAALTLFC